MHGSCHANHAASRFVRAGIVALHARLLALLALSHSPNEMPDALIRRAQEFKKYQSYPNEPAFANAIGREVESASGWLRLSDAPKNWPNRANPAWGGSIVLAGANSVAAWLQLNKNFNHPAQATFENDFFAALRPGRIVAPLVFAIKEWIMAGGQGMSGGIASTAAESQQSPMDLVRKPYVALHLRFEELAGSKYVKNAVDLFGYAGGKHYGVKNATRIAHLMERELKIPRGTPLLVVTGEYNEREQDLRPLRERYRVMTKEDYFGPVLESLSSGREERAVIDLFLASGAQTFIGHSSSTFSQVVCRMRLGTAIVDQKLRDGEEKRTTFFTSSKHKASPPPTHMYSSPDHAFRIPWILNGDGGCSPRAEDPTAEGRGIFAGTLEALAAMRKRLQAPTTTRRATPAAEPKPKPKTKPAGRQLQQHDHSSKRTAPAWYRSDHSNAHKNYTASSHASLPSVRAQRREQQPHTAAADRDAAETDPPVGHLAGGVGLVLVSMLLLAGNTAQQAKRAWSINRKMRAEELK